MTSGTSDAGLIRITLQWITITGLGVDISREDGSSFQEHSEYTFTHGDCCTVFTLWSLDEPSLERLAESTMLQQQPHRLQ